MSNGSRRTGLQFINDVIDAKITEKNGRAVKRDKWLGMHDPEKCKHSYVHVSWVIDVCEHCGRIRKDWD